MGLDPISMMGISAGIGAGGSALSGIIGSGAATSAAKTQSQAAAYAAAQQMAMFNMGQQNFQPYLNAGGAAAGSLQTLLGIGGGAGNPLGGSPLASKILPDFTSIFGGDSGQKWLENTPGYQFTLNQGLKNTQAVLSGQGLGGVDAKLGGAGGALAKGLSQYTTGLASGTFQQQFQNYLAANQQGFSQILQGIVDPLTKLAGLGQSSAAGVGALGVQSQTAANQLLTSGAAATAGGTVGSANAITGGIGGIGSAAQQYALLSALTSGGMFGKPAGGGWGSDLGVGIPNSTINPFGSA